VLEPQQNIFRRQSNASSSALRANYRVAYLLAEKRKTFSDDEFVRKYLQHIVQEVSPKKETAFNTVSLSHETMTRRVEDIKYKLLNQLRNKEK
jgi:hypothetical protein